MGVGGERVPHVLTRSALSYERFLELLIPVLDGQIAYTTGDPLRLLEDAQIIKPTMFAGVPRVLNRIHQAIMAQVLAGGLKGNLLKRAIDTKVENFKKTGAMTHALYDALVFKKVRRSASTRGGPANLGARRSAPSSAARLPTLAPDPPPSRPRSTTFSAPALAARLSRALA